MQLLSLPTTRAALRSLIFASSPPSFSSTPTPNKASGTSPGQRHSFGALAVEIFLEEYKIDGYLNAQCNSKVNSRSTIAEKEGMELLSLHSTSTRQSSRNDKENVRSYALYQKGNLSWKVSGHVTC
ncbi:hypothetical protein JHK82_019453 [Glycine max]|uniref:Uncharacterized protein n=1 Tax=Glycine max TaxID=3847 RepID=K7L341_SOYBN|nr:hypothetical protein JHK87_019327 [Glycine soja]KAG5023551.1 hypothetical protein JHK85_019893 [Glycine max]KAG5038629.1 hypothetical protein JHK86_019469 [Glycine max]KAG5143758.1 hypothetical protein JHK82_019453 [Glycine max]KAH1087975.1 hypothetical protein GYH30_019175 [Glycine max]